MGFARGKKSYASGSLVRDDLDRTRGDQQRFGKDRVAVEEEEFLDKAAPTGTSSRRSTVGCRRRGVLGQGSNGWSHRVGVLSVGTTLLASWRHRRDR